MVCERNAGDNPDDDAKTPGGKTPAEEKHDAGGAANGQAKGKPKLTREILLAGVTDWLRVLLAKDQVTELRAIKVKKSPQGKPHTESGFFDYDHVAEMAKAALDITPHARAVYFTLNPLKEDILARRAYTVDWAEDRECASDKDVIGRRWLLIDADPTRDSLVSSTDGEKAEALKVISEVRDFLTGRGWPLPILGDSGNGYHLLYRVDLPADDASVENILKALASRFDTGRVKIDKTVFNPSRVCKLPGTMACKGSNISKRPHRRSSLLEVPG